MLILVYGQGHQGFLMIEVDEKTLKGKIIDADLWHSFAQYIEYKGQNLYVLEQSEGSGRTQLTKYDRNNLAGTPTTIPLLKYGGDRSGTWAISCYASVDGMALSKDNILCIGTSIDQSKYGNVNSSTAHNIYLTITPMNSFSESSTKVKWLTNYANNGKAFTGVAITKINDNKFMVSWEEYGENQNITDNDTLSRYKLHYVFIDQNGNKIGKEYTANASFSDCKPLVKENKIVYYASSNNMIDFYTIDSSTGAFSKSINRVAGENATWSLDKNGTLTISGQGAITANPNASNKSPISSTGGRSEFELFDTWRPVRESVRKIVIENGITSIPDSEFERLTNVVEVVLPNTMEKIGKEAFSGCDALRRILVPSSVKSIGEDAFWAGYWTYDYSKFHYETIYTTKNSYAESWAKKNNITTKLLGDVNNDGKVNAKDARETLRHYVGTTKLDDYKLFAADVNNDGRVNAKDARKILQYYVGTIKNF